MGVRAGNPRVRLFVIEGFENALHREMAVDISFDGPTVIVAVPAEVLPLEAAWPILRRNVLSRRPEIVLIVVSYLRDRFYRCFHTPQLLGNG